MARDVFPRRPRDHVEGRFDAILSEAKDYGPRLWLGPLLSEEDLPRAGGRTVNLGYLS